MRHQRDIQIEPLVHPAVSLNAVIAFGGDGGDAADARQRLECCAAVATTAACRAVNIHDGVGGERSAEESMCGAGETGILLAPRAGLVACFPALELQAGRAVGEIGRDVAGAVEFVPPVGAGLS